MFKILLILIFSLISLSSFSTILSDGKKIKSKTRLEIQDGTIESCEAKLKDELASITMELPLEIIAPIYIDECKRKSANNPAGYTIKASIEYSSLFLTKIEIEGGTIDECNNELTLVKKMLSLGKITPMRINECKRVNNARYIQGYDFRASLVYIKY